MQVCGATKLPLAHAMASESSNDNIEHEESIADLLEPIRKRMLAEDATQDGDKARYVSSAMRVETPVTLLVDTRDIMSSMLSEMCKLRVTAEEAEKNNERRHRELCTILLGSGGRRDSLSTISSRLATPGSPSVEVASRGSHYYYGGTAMRVGYSILACILIHLDMMVARQMEMDNSTSADNVFMSIKDWNTVCHNILNTVAPPKEEVRVPKPSDQDFKTACSIACSTIEGRVPRCEPSQLNTLLSQCPEIMSSVEWLRMGILRCRGLVSPLREKRLSSITYPYINASKELVVAVKRSFKLTPDEHFRKVNSLKQAEKKTFISLVLVSNQSPYTSIYSVNPDV